MYHIQNDPRAQTSAAMICEAFLTALREKSYDEITVSDIQRLSTVSRSTFYRHFDSMADLLSLLCDRGFAEIFADPDGRSLHMAVLHYWYEHGDLLEAIVRAGRVELFLDSFRRAIEKAGTLRFVDTESADFGYLLSTIVYVMIGTLAEWIRRGRRESEVELAAALKNAFTVIEAMNMLE